MRIRPTISATLTAVLLLAANVAASAAPPPPLTDQPTVGAAAAASWLVSSIDGSGLATGPTGRPDPNTTRQSIMALALVGAGDATVDRALSALGSAPEALVDSSGAGRPAALAELIIAVVASGGDPRSFGTGDAQTDLVRRLEETRRTSGADTGLYGAQDPTFDGAYRQGLALVALAAAGSPPEGAEWLRNQQCADGSWTAYRSDLSSACPSIDPLTFTGPDTNSTALGAIGLAAAGDPADPTTISWLAAHRATDGGWAYLPTDGAPSDPNSTALVISALDATGSDADEGVETSARAVLTRFQFGCDASNSDRGALWFPPFAEEDGYVASSLATAQALIAMAGVDLADVGPTGPRAVSLDCDGATATTTTTAPSTTIPATPTTDPTQTTTATGDAVLGTSTVQATAATPQSTTQVPYTG